MKLITGTLKFLLDVILPDSDNSNDSESEHKYENRNTYYGDCNGVVTGNPNEDIYEYKN